MPPVQHLLGLLLQWRRPRTRPRLRCVRGRSGGEHVSRPGLRSGGSSGFRGNAGVSKFHAPDQREHTRSASRVASAVLQVSACSSVGFRKGPQHRHCLPDSVTKSFLHVGDVILRREDTSRTGVQVENPSGD